MTFHMPSGIEILAILVIAFVGGFAWTAGGWVFMKLVGAVNQKRPAPA
jgi:hypothetical protein